jgi:hypothetical protein
MNKRVKRLWIKALRSGKYKQGQGQLCIEQPDGLEHCCLGVLEEIAITCGVIDNYEHCSGSLDRTVKEWAGLQTTNPRLGPRVDSRTASWLNDKGKSFTFIADRIEKYL